MKLNEYQLGAWVEYCGEYYKLTYLAEYAEECIIEFGEKSVNLTGKELAEIRPIILSEAVLYSIHLNIIELPQGGAMSAFPVLRKNPQSGAFSAEFHNDKAKGTLTIRPKSKNPFELRIESSTGEYCKIKRSVLFLHEFQSLLIFFEFYDLANGLNPDDSLALARRKEALARREAMKLLPENKSKEESI